MSRLGNLVIILAAVALSCWPVPSLAAPPGHSYQDSVRGEVTLLRPIDAVTVYQEYKATGRSNPLGRIEVSGSHFVEFTGADENGTFGVVAGQFIYTTRDGSTITGTYSGTFRHDERGHAMFSVAVVVGDGTGRLEGVTGTAVTDVDADGPLAGDHFAWTTQGEVTFPG